MCFYTGVLPLHSRAQTMRLLPLREEQWYRPGEIDRDSLTFPLCLCQPCLQPCHSKCTPKVPSQPATPAFPGRSLDKQNFDPSPGLLRWNLHSKKFTAHLCARQRLRDTFYRTNPGTRQLPSATSVSGRFPGASCGKIPGCSSSPAGTQAGGGDMEFAVARYEFKF